MRLLLLSAIQARKRIREAEDSVGVLRNEFVTWCVGAHSSNPAAAASSKGLVADGDLSAGPARRPSAEASTDGPSPRRARRSETEPAARLDPGQRRNRRPDDAEPSAGRRDKRVTRCPDDAAPAERRKLRECDIDTRDL